MDNKNDKNHKNKAAVSGAMILIAAAGWGIIGVFSRPLAAMGLEPFGITFIRSFITAAGIGIFIIIKDRSLFRISLRDIWMFLGTGLVSIVFFNVCYFITIEQTTLATASILLYTAPCFVMLMSALFFGEKITSQKIFALVFAFLGCVLASGFAGGDITPKAFISGIGSGVGYAAYSIFGKAALKKYRPFTVIFYTFAVASAGLLPFTAGGVIPFMSAHPDAVAVSLELGIVSTLMPFILYTTGLEYTEAGKASVLAFAEPMVAAVSGIVIFKEELCIKNAVGILLIFFSIILLNIPFKIKYTEKIKSRM